MKTMITVLCTGTLTAALFAQSSSDITQPKVFKSAEGETLNYRIYMPMKLARLLLQDVIANLPVDINRIYVTGISMGGYATWDIIQRKPNLFAAAIPICGGADATRAPSLKNLPIWAFHGDKDTAVPVSRSRDMVKALRDCGSQVQYREYPGAGHDVWTRTYADSSVLAWLFAQRRAAAPTGASR